MFTFNTSQKLHGFRVPKVLTSYTTQKSIEHWLFSTSIICFPRPYASSGYSPRPLSVFHVHMQVESLAMFRHNPSFQLHNCRLVNLCFGSLWADHPVTLPVVVVKEPITYFLSSVSSGLWPPRTPPHILTTWRHIVRPHSLAKSSGVTKPAE